MSGYLDYMSGTMGMPQNFYEQQMQKYSQQLEQLRQANPYVNQYVPQPMMQQPMMQQPMMQQPIPQPVQQPIQQQPQQSVYDNNLYLQTLFMEFLRSPEMSDFTTNFYTKFGEFFKKKTGVEYDEPQFVRQIKQQTPPQQVAEQPYIIEQ